MHVHNGVIIVDDEYDTNDDKKDVKGLAVIDNDDEGLERYVLLGRRFNWFNR